MDDTDLAYIRSRAAAFSSATAKGVPGVPCPGPVPLSLFEETQGPAHAPPVPQAATNPANRASPAPAHLLPAKKAGSVRATPHAAEPASATFHPNAGRAREDDQKQAVDSGRVPVQSKPDLLATSVTSTALEESETARDANAPQEDQENRAGSLLLVLPLEEYLLDVFDDFSEVLAVEKALANESTDGAHARDESVLETLGPGEERWDLFPPVMDPTLGLLPLDDVDEYDPTATRDDGLEPDIDRVLGREDRARQVAAEVLNRAGWDPAHLPILQEVFLERGWAATRVAIEREIANGLQPEELALANQVKWYWEHHEKYWISFGYFGRTCLGEKSRAVYRCLGWPDALRIVRCFPSYPAIEEVYELIEEAFERWYDSKCLRSHFKTFLGFLLYRLGGHWGALPGPCPSYFDDPAYEDWEASSDTYYVSNGPTTQYLARAGIVLSFPNKTW